MAKTFTKTSSRKTSKPIRLGLVGVGRAGWGMHCSELDKKKKMYEIVAACDIDPARCEMMAEKYGCKTYSKIEDLLADKDVELVDIATRSTDHIAHALMALKAGKRVHLEKPIAVSAAEAGKLKRAVGTSKNKLFVRHNRRFEPCFQHVREIIASGILGDVYSVKLRRHQYQQRGDWQTIIGCGGGQLLNWGPHLVDHALQFVGYDVAEMWSDLKLISALGDAEDHLKICIKNSKGLLVDVEISGGAAIPEAVYLVCGTRGSLKSVDEKTIELRYIDPKQTFHLPPADPGTPRTDASFGSSVKVRWIEKSVKVKAPYDMSSLWDFMYDSIRSRKAYPIKLEESLAVMDVISKVKKGTQFDMPKSAKKKATRKKVARK